MSEAKKIIDGLRDALAGNIHLVTVYCVCGVAIKAPFDDEENIPCECGRHYAIRRGVAK